jgi:capsular polysaccharide biosynthesis protein
VAGLVSPGVAFVVDYFDPSLRTPDELRSALQIPVLAVVPVKKGRSYVS